MSAPTKKGMTSGPMTEMSKVKSVAAGAVDSSLSKPGTRTTPK